MEKEKLTILVVEDQPINRQILSTLLSIDYTVLEAGNGAEALACLAAHPEIAAILLAALGERLGRQVKITLGRNDEALTALADQGFDPNFGARPLRRLLVHTVETALSKEIIKGEVREGDTVNIGFEDGQFTFRKA